MEPLLDTENETLLLKSFTRAAIRENQILLFRLRKDPTASTGYRLEHRLSFEEPYYAISHSWTDRTGSGDSIIVTDLAPWSICLSPAKRGFLDWLFCAQDIKPGESDIRWTSWYWMDLLCIDQAREDEELFSKQLQQIPQVFGNAAACLAILASWPCANAMAMPEPASTTDAVDDASTVEYDALAEWSNRHLADCSCLPLIDAWLTRVWTRQELLYSRKIIVITANLWLSPHHKSSSDIWVQKPQFYIPPAVTQGLDELSSCLITWATKNRRPIRFYAPAVIARIVRALIRGQPIEETIISEDVSNVLPKSSFAEWFAFNWSMLLNGSIRYTSHRRDAIISQMLFIPGYQVPRNPWSKPLEAIAVDAASQFRRLLHAYQLVATIIGLDPSKATSPIGKPIITESFNEKGGLADILHAVGSPLVLPKRFHDQERDCSNSSELMVYRPNSSPRYRVLDEIDIIGRPLETARHILGLATLWAKAADCRTSWNVRDCFEEIETLTSCCLSDHCSPKNLLQLARALKHCLGRMTNSVCFTVMTIPRRTSPQYSRPYNDEEVDDLKIPRAFLVMVRYKDANIASHASILFGDLNMGEEGEI